jgi:hypothetical protein
LRTPILSAGARAFAREPNAGSSERQERFARNQLMPCFIHQYQFILAGSDNLANGGRRQFGIRPESERDQQIGPPEPRAAR